MALLFAIHHNRTRLKVNGERIDGGGAGLESRHKNQPVEAMHQSNVWADAQIGRRRRKENEKSDFSFLSFGTATMVFALVL